VPHDLIVPYLAFDQSNFEGSLRTIPRGGVASREYTQIDAVAAIKANTK
jgi:ribose transport system substrate-binding protein